MNAATLNKVLIASIVLIIGTAMGTFYYARQILNAQALELSHARTNLRLENERITALKELKEEVEARSEEREQAADIVTDLANYRYQNEMVKDIYTIADSTKIVIVGYEFTDVAVGSNSPTTSPSTATPEGSTTLPAGVKIAAGTLTLEKSVDYKSLLRFIIALEKNLSRMQITGLDLTLDQDNPGKVVVNSISLKIFVRSDATSSR